MQARIPGKSSQTVLDILVLSANLLDVELCYPHTTGNRVTFRLKPIYGRANKYQRTTTSPFSVTKSGEQRRVAAICWHGYRDFFRTAYALDENIIFRTHRLSPRGDVVYENSEHFEKTYRDTAYTNVGSSMYPVLMCEACACPDSGEAC